jgi:hypothetical protein
MRWAWCSDTKDISELELEGDRNGSGLLGLNSGNVHLEGSEGSDQVDWRGDSSQGGRGCHGNLLLLQHGLGGHDALSRGDDGGLDGGDGHGQVGWSDVSGDRSDGDSVEVKGRRSCHDKSWVGVEPGLDLGQRLVQLGRIQLV